MLFQTFVFALFFLVTVLLIYCTKGYVQRIILLCASLFFYAYGSIPHLLVFGSVIIVTFLFGILIEMKRNRSLFVISLVFCFMPLIIFKYADFILSQITSLSLFFHVEYLIAPPPVLLDVLLI
jgi:D-alanyl-lipoteichoic acid acyltransferase DltB (MBOAT superfamily)